MDMGLGTRLWLSILSTLLSMITDMTIVTVWMDNVIFHQGKSRKLRNVVQMQIGTLPTTLLYRWCQDVHTLRHKRKRKGGWGVRSSIVCSPRSCWIHRSLVCILTDLWWEMEVPPLRFPRCPDESWAPEEGHSIEANAIDQGRITDSWRLTAGVDSMQQRKENVLISFTSVWSVIYNRVAQDRLINAQRGWGTL